MKNISLFILCFSNSSWDTNELISVLSVLLTSAWHGAEHHSSRSAYRTVRGSPSSPNPCNHKVDWILDPEDFIWLESFDGIEHMVCTPSVILVPRHQPFIVFNGFHLFLKYNFKRAVSMYLDFSSWSSRYIGGIASSPYEMDNTWKHLLSPMCSTNLDFSPIGT